MQTDIYARKFSLTKALKNHAEQRIYSSFAHCDQHILRVVLRLSDTNGPRGGKDKRCLLLVMMVDAPDVIIEDIETDLYVAIDRAVERASRVTLRKVKQRKTQRKMRNLSFVGNKAAYLH